MVSIKIEMIVLIFLTFNFVFPMVWNSGLPEGIFTGQRFNSTSLHFEDVTDGSNATYWGGSGGIPAELNNTYKEFNQTKISASGLTDPLALVGMVGTYLNMFWVTINNFGNNNLATGFFLNKLIGAKYGGIISFLLTIALVMLAIRIITGRLLWK